MSTISACLMKYRILLKQSWHIIFQACKAAHSGKVQVIAGGSAHIACRLCLPQLHHCLFPDQLGGHGSRPKQNQLPHSGW